METHSVDWFRYNQAFNWQTSLNYVFSEDLSYFTVCQKCFCFHLYFLKEKQSCNSGEKQVQNQHLYEVWQNVHTDVSEKLNVLRSFTTIYIFSDNWKEKYTCLLKKMMQIPGQITVKNYFKISVYLKEK